MVGICGICGWVRNRSGDARVCGSYYENANIYLGSLSGAFGGSLSPAREEQGQRGPSTERGLCSPEHLPTRTAPQSLTHKLGPQTSPPPSDDLMCFPGIGLSLDIARYRCLAIPS